MILIISVDRISAQSARADQSLLLISQSPRDPETSIGAVAEGSNELVCDWTCILRYATQELMYRAIRTSKASF